TSDLSDLESAVAYHVGELSKKLRQRGLLTSRMTVFIAPSRHGDFVFHRGTAEIHLEHPTNANAELLREALNAVRKVFDPQVPYKKAGAVFGGLLPLAYSTGDLFSHDPKPQYTKLDEVVD